MRAVRLFLLSRLRALEPPLYSPCGTGRDVNISSPCLPRQPTDGPSCCIASRNSAFCNDIAAAHYRLRSGSGGVKPQQEKPSGAVPPDIVLWYRSDLRERGESEAER